jgi:sulfur-carrier protein
MHVVVFSDIYHDLGRTVRAAASGRTLILLEPLASVASGILASSARGFRRIFAAGGQEAAGRKIAMPEMKFTSKIATKNMSEKKIIKVKYFGMIAEAVGKGQEEIEMPTYEADLRAFFVDKYPKLVEMTWKIAVDQELVEGIVTLQDRAEVVLLPPFAGG